MDAIDTAEHTEDVLEFLMSLKLNAPDALVVLQFAVDRLLTLSGGSTQVFVEGLQLVRAATPA